jgi:hypothetical protein
MPSLTWIRPVIDHIRALTILAKTLFSNLK